MRYKEYSAYLRSAAWERRKQEIIRNNPNARCHCCAVQRSQRIPLDLHHLHYNTVGAERDGDVVPVCRPCHQAIHRVARAERISISMATDKLRKLSDAANIRVSVYAR